MELDNSRQDITDADVLERLDEALALIERFEPIRFDHLKRDVRAIRVERYPCRGAFIPSERTIITELTFLARRDITAAPVASSILHEGVHARVNAFRDHAALAAASSVRAGFGSGEQSGDRERERDMAREERLCRRSELAFGRKLPEELGAPVVERALATLGMDDEGVAPRIDWGLAMQRQQAVDRGEL